MDSDGKAPGTVGRLSAFALLLALTAAAYALAVWQFLYALNLCVTAIRLRGGLAGIAFLGGIIVLGLALLSFLIAAPAYYAKGLRRNQVPGYFFRMTAVQAFLLAALRILFFMAVPLIFKPGWEDFLIGGGGCAAGTVCAVLARRFLSPRGASGTGNAAART